jgi:hypothetical protein
MKRFFICGLCVIAGLSLASNVSAAKKAASPSPSPGAATAAAPAAAPAAAKADRPIPFHGMISAVDAKAKTFTIAGKEKSRVFKITDKTVVTKAGNPATMKDVVANEEVRGSYWKEADGSLEAKSVKLGPKTDAEKAAEKPKAKKGEASPSPSPKA